MQATDDPLRGSAGLIDSRSLIYSIRDSIIIGRREKSHPQYQGKHSGVIAKCWHGEEMHIFAIAATWIFLSRFNRLSLDHNSSGVHYEKKRAKSEIEFLSVIYNIFRVSEGADHF